MGSDAMQVRDAAPGYVVEAQVQDVPPGYKRTEVGVIPQDWTVRTIAEVASVKTGPFGSALHERDYVQDGTPIITVEHLSELGVVHENLPCVSDSDRARLKNYGLRQNDIVFSRVGSVDRNSLISKAEDGWLFSGRLLRIRVSNASAYPPFLSYYFHFEPFKQRVREVAVGQTMASLNTQILNSIKIVLPTPAEQRAIAEALSDVDGLLGTLEALIAKKRAIKQAAMQQLLTGKTRLPGFSGAWETKRLGNLAEMASGGTPKSTVAAYYGGNIPWVSIVDMTQGGKLITQTERNLSELGFSQSTARMYPAGTILYAMYASLGECSIAGVELCSSQAILGISTGRALDSEFLYYWLTAIKATVKELGQQGTQANLNKGMVQGFQISLPSIEEQSAIATVLSDMDAEIAALEARRDKSRALKQGMMQQLLTGRVRLVKPAPTEAAT